MRSDDVSVYYRFQDIAIGLKSINLIIFRSPVAFSAFVCDFVEISGIVFDVRKRE